MMDNVLIYLYIISNTVIAHTQGDRRPNIVKTSTVLFGYRKRIVLSARPNKYLLTYSMEQSPS